MQKSDNNTASVKRIFAIGDLEGHDILAHKVTKYLEKTATTNDTVIFLGNVIGCGKESKDALDTVYSYVKKNEDGKSGPRAYLLKGRNEMLTSLLRKKFLNSPVGKAIVQSYVKKSFTTKEIEAQNFQNDRSYLQQLPYFFAAKNFFFCNGGVDPDKDLEENILSTLVVNPQADKFLTSTKDFGKVVVYGQYPVKQGKVCVRKNRINISGCFDGTNGPQKAFCVVLDDDNGKVLDTLCFED